MPLKISGFLWKLLGHALPTDAAVQRKGIPLISKCLCCVLHPSAETSTHLFLQSEAASLLWSKLSDLFEMNVDTSTISQFLYSGWAMACVNNLKQWLHLVVPAVGLWHLWKGHNCADYEDQLMNRDNILFNTQRYVKYLSLSHSIALDSGGISKECMLFFHLSNHSIAHIL